MSGGTTRVWDRRLSLLCGPVPISNARQTTQPIAEPSEIAYDAANTTMRIAVTGAYGYSGRYVPRRLLEAGHEVLTLTNLLCRANPFGDRIRAYPFHFEQPSGLSHAARTQSPPSPITYIGCWMLDVGCFGSSRSQCVCGSRRRLHCGSPSAEFWRRGARPIASPPFGVRLVENCDANVPNQMIAG